MLSFAIRNPLKGQKVTVPAVLNTTLKSLVTAFQPGTVRILLQNIDAAATLYWHYGTAAPAGSGSMGQIAPGQILPIEWQVEDLDHLYVYTAGGTDAYVLEEGIGH